jgi:cytochrome c oxidase subunit 4
MSHTANSIRTYVGVFAGLIGLTIATVALAQLNLGAWHGPVGLVIAGIKATLIVVFFMHLLRLPRVTWMVALSGLFWLGLLISFTLADVVTRASPM